MAITSGKSYDVLIIGGGVIGLSLAWELAQHGAKACVVDRGELGKEASWAGAGMIPSGPATTHWEQATPSEQLAGLSQRLHAAWHAKLRDLTDIDNQYRRCGSVQLAFTSAEAESLDRNVERWRLLGIECLSLDSAAIYELEPALTPKAADFARAYHLPAEAQMRNPRHLRALIAACRLEGVDLRPGVTVRGFENSTTRVQRAVTSDGPIPAEQFCLTTGSWSAQILSKLGIALPVRPIRGQIVLLKGPPGLLQRNIALDSRYLTPRHDGRVLVGSTMEDVGFVKENTEAATAELLAFTDSIAPEVAHLPIETRWSGLRPQTADGLPYLGRLPNDDNGWENAWLATGHFRAGLQLSPATAVVMRALILGQEPAVDVASLGVRR